MVVGEVLAAPDGVGAIRVVGVVPGPVGVGQDREG